MKTLLSFFRIHLGGIIIYLVTIFLFFTSLFLYQMPLEPVLYGFILSFTIAAIITIIRFIRFYKKHLILTDLRTKIIISCGELPETYNIIESDYQNLLTIINDYTANKTYEKDYVLRNMTEYYAMWAHQIKVPISALHLILQSDECVNFSETAEIQNQIFKIEQYVEMVLQYLRLSSKNNDFLIREYSLDNITKKAVKKYAKLFIRKKIKLLYEPLNCNVISDAKWLGFIIEQILSNCLKYTSKGSVTILMDSKNTKTLIIRDTGIGISPEDLPRIFEDGFTGYNGRSDKKSTGIGLFLCKKAADKLNHRIEIFSDNSAGTTVKIHLEQTNIRPI